MGVRLVARAERIIRMATPPRLVPLLEQFDWACLRLLNRMTGPEVDSGNGMPIAVPPITDEEYLWEPVPGCVGPPPGGRAWAGRDGPARRRGVGA